MRCSILLKLLILVFLCSTYFFIKDRTAVVGQEETQPMESSEQIEKKEDTKEPEERKESNQTKKEPKKEKKSPQKKQEQKLIKNYEEIAKINKQVIGWIQIPNMVVDYPVLYAKDNEFYLTHNERNQKSKNGAIFLDASLDGVFGRINLIHGHNLKSGRMFGDLDLYKFKDFLEKNKEIKIVQNGEVKKYQVFSVFNFDAANEKIETGFAKEEEYQSYFKRLKKRSRFPLTAPSSIQSIIILNTCSYEFTNAHFLVCAYLKEE